MNRSPIPVLHFTNSTVRGGAEEHLLTLLRRLDRNRFHLHLVCPPQLVDSIKGDLPADVELLPLEWLRPRQAGQAYRLARILRSRRVKVLHSHMFWSSLFASPVGWFCRVPAIIETPHLREHWRHGWLKGRYFIDRWVGRMVDYFVAVSEANARYLTQEKRLPPRKVVVIRNGCNLAKFVPGRPCNAKLRAALELDESRQVLVVLARLEPQKGHRVLLDALPIVRREFPRLSLVVVGEGSLRGELERQSRERGVHDAVRFVGYQANVEDWLALADLTVLPSFYEGLPLAAIESLASGKPVVASAVDGTPEIVIDGQTGLTVPPGDPGRLAEAILQLLRDPELRRRLGCSGRQRVEEHFGQENQIRRTQELYLRALELQGRTGQRENLPVGQPLHPEIPAADRGE